VYNNGVYDQSVVREREGQGESKVLTKLQTRVFKKRIPTRSSIDPQNYGYKKYNGEEEILKLTSNYENEYEKEKWLNINRLDRTEDIETLALPYYVKKRNVHVTKKAI